MERTVTRRFAWWPVHLDWCYSGRSGWVWWKYYDDFAMDGGSYKQQALDRVEE